MGDREGGASRSIVRRGGRRIYWILGLWWRGIGRWGEGVRFCVVGGGDGINFIWEGRGEGRSRSEPISRSVSRLAFTARSSMYTFAQGFPKWRSVQVSKSFSEER